MKRDSVDVAEVFTPKLTQGQGSYIVRRIAMKNEKERP